MERMKIEIEKSEYDRLKSREEKYLAYMDMLSYRGEDETYVDALCGKVAELEEENENLRDTNGDLQRWLKQTEDMFKFQQEENKKLKEELSKYKKYYDRDKEELMESCYSLAKENDKLKSDLSECECSFGFESDEVGYRKREYKKLKEKVRFLEQCLDNKEKVNKNLREELQEWLNAVGNK